MKKHVAAVFCLLMVSSTGFAQDSRYRVDFQLDVSGGVNSIFKRANMIITGLDIVNPVTGLPDSESSFAIQVPFHGWGEDTFMDPFTLSAMLEEGLNDRRVTLQEVLEFLSHDKWAVEFGLHPISKKLRAPKYYRVKFQIDVTSGVTTQYKRASLIMTGPDIIDDAGQPTYETSYSIKIPFHGLEDNSIDPYALAAMLEEGLNNRKVRVREVLEFFNREDWITNYATLPLSRKLKAPREYRVSFEADATDGVNQLFKSARLMITGPGIYDSFTGLPSSESSYAARVPFHGWMDAFMDPFAMAALYEDGLNNGTVKLKEVLDSLDHYEWPKRFEFNVVRFKLLPGSLNCPDLFP